MHPMPALFVRRPPWIAAALAIMLSTSPQAHAEDGWSFQVGLSYVSGHDELADRIRENNPTFAVKRLSPVGLSASAAYYYGGGFGVGIKLGPAIIGTGDADFHIVPIALDLRYRLHQGESNTLYVRAGAETASVGGDFVKSRGTGAVLALGAEFGRPGGVRGGIEIGAHSTEVEVKATPGRTAKKVKPYEFTVSGFVAF